MQPFPKPDPRDGDETGKIFVGALSWDTTHDSLLKYFSRYGEVIDCVVMKNQATGKSRGFGFVKFKDPDCVETVLASGPHTLDGRQIDPKSCNPRSLNKGGKNAEKNKNKIFLGGLPTNCTEVEIREVFGKFGKVIDVVIMFDQEKQKSRGGGGGLAGAGLGVGLGAGGALVNHPGAASWMSAGGAVEADTIPCWSQAATASTQSSPYLSPSALASTAVTASPTLTSSLMGTENSGAERAYLTNASPVPSAGQIPTSPEGAQAEKAGYLIYNGQSPHIGLLGSYPQEASSYGPARVLSPDAKSLAFPGGATPYSHAGIAYAPSSPQMTQIPGIYSAMNPSYGGLGLSLPAMAYPGSHPELANPAYSPTMIPARTLTAAQAFHPYRRFDDGR